MTAAASTVPASGAGRRRLSQREVFLGLAIVLALVLVVLIAMVLGMLADLGAQASAGSEIEGIRALLVIDGPGRGPHPRFGKPMGVAVDDNGRIYVTDMAYDRVCVFDSKGRFLFEFGGLGVAKPLPGYGKTWQPGRLNKPVGIAIDEGGDVFVADFRNDQVQVFDADGKPLRAFPDPYAPVGRGSSGQDGGGIAVTDVAVAHGRVFATDAYQVFEFTTDGEFVRQFGKPGRSENALDHPNGIGVTDDWKLIVADSNHSRVTAFSDEGAALWTVGTIPVDLRDHRAGAFELPRGLAVLDDSVAVIDAFRSQINILTLGGRVVGRYGSRGSAPGQFSFPNDIAPLGRDFVVADRDNTRVQIVSLVGWSDETRQPDR